jgi:hypothetical protein
MGMEMGMEKGRFWGCDFFFSLMILLGVTFGVQGNEDTTAF